MIGYFVLTSKFDNGDSESDSAIKSIGDNMPLIPNFINEFFTSLTFVDHRGQKRSVVIKRSLNTPEAIVLAGTLAGRIASASNAVVFKRTETTVGEARIATLTAFDEAESSANVVGVLVFRRVGGELDYVEVPAIDAQFIDASGDALTVDLLTPNTIGEIVTDFLALNPTAAYERSFIATRKGTRNKQVARPSIAEPNVGQEPSGLPDDVA